MIESLLGWFFFSVLLSSLPVVFNGYRAWVNGDRELLIAAFGRGELFVLAAALCATGIERVYSSEAGWRPGKIAMSGLATSALVACALLFADTSAPGRRPRLTNTRTVVRSSIIMYVIAGLTGAACVIIAEDW